MTDKPILFSAPMIRALLDGRKTQTRRVVKKEAALNALAVFGPDFLLKPGNADLLPYQIGSRLWVRETWCPGFDYDDDDKPVGDERIFYRATDNVGCWFDPDREETRDSPPWKPSIFMPRAASRLTLTVTDIRAQRLQDISEEDAEAEGPRFGTYGRHTLWSGRDNERPTLKTAREAFLNHIWEDIHADHDTASAGANPWVWALTFEVLHLNIDEVLK